MTFIDEIALLNNRALNKMRSSLIFFPNLPLGFARQFFYSLRHTFVSELANADVPADVRRQISGHSDEKIHERYTHLSLDTKRRALAHLRPLGET